MKIGRNEPCPCGSGKKYKKCCLGKGLPAQVEINPERMQFSSRIAPPQSITKDGNASSFGDKVLVKTTADELFLPCRIIGRVYDYENVCLALKKLNCIDHDPNEKRWVINCDDELLKEKWPSIYKKNAKKQTPIIVGVIRFPNEKRMDIYLRSFERVVPILKLLDGFISGEDCVFTHLDKYQRLTFVEDRNDIPPIEVYFSDESEIDYPKIFQEVDRLEELGRTTGKNYEKEINQLYKKMAEESFGQTPKFNELERVRLESFYSDGPDDLKERLKFQEAMVVMRHKKGDSFDYLETIQEAISGKASF